MPDKIRHIHKKIPINDNYISYTSLASYTMPMHHHRELQILVPLEGSHFEITWALENKQTESKSLGSSDICIMPPFLEHEVHWMGSANFVSYFITPNYMHEHVEGGYDLEANIIEARIGFDDPFIYQTAQSLRHYLLNSQGTNYRYFDATLTVVSQHIISNYLQHSQNVTKFYNSDDQPCSKIKQATLYMHNNLERSLSVEEIADSIHMSHYHFIRTFKSATGMTPSKFHMMLRIEKAKEMLKRKDAIIDVATALGFSSQSHFSNVFTKSVGMTPRKFANY